MSVRTRLLVLFLALGGVAYGASTVFTAPAPKPKDELRWVKIENQEIFNTMGARTWRLHVPADQLAGKAQFVLKMARDDGKPETVLTAPLHERKESDPLDVTVVLYWDTPSHQNVTRIHYAISSPEFYYTCSKGNPLPGFNGYGRPNDLGDLTKGIELGRLTKSDNNAPKEEKVVFSLWLE